MDVSDAPPKFFYSHLIVFFRIAVKKVLKTGILVAGIANRNKAFDLLTCYASILPENRQNLYAWVFSKEDVNIFQIEDHVIDYDQETTISGSLQWIPA